MYQRGFSRTYGGKVSRSYLGPESALSTHVAQDYGGNECVAVAHPDERLEDLVLLAQLCAASEQLRLGYGLDLGIPLGLLSGREKEGVGHSILDKCVEVLVAEGGKHLISVGGPRAQVARGELVERGKDRGAQVSCRDIGTGLGAGGARGLNMGTGRRGEGAKGRTKRKGLGRRAPRGTKHSGGAGADDREEAHPSVGRSAGRPVGGSSREEEVVVGGRGT